MEAPHVHKRLHQIEKEGVERQFGTTIIAAKAVAETSMTRNSDGSVQVARRGGCSPE
jgi:hypothetical protein